MMYQRGKREKVGGKHSWRLILIVTLLLTLLASIPAKTRKPATSECMKNPFATGCRGISAKRSSGNLLLSQQPQPQKQPQPQPQQPLTQQQLQLQRAFAAITSSFENTLLPQTDKWSSSLARHCISANLILASMPVELLNELAWWSSINSAAAYYPYGQQLEPTGTE